jgi:site-specific recombinase XerD
MMRDTPPRLWRVHSCSTNPSWPDLPEPLRQRFGTLAALQERHHAREGQRFLIGPDGRPDLRVNAFFVSPMMRVRSENTNRKYAYSLAIWLNFLSRHGEGRRWDEATSDEIEAFKFWRMTDPRNHRRVTGTTWHTDLAALSAFYGWTARKYGVSNPIVLRELRPHRRAIYASTQTVHGPTEMAAEPGTIRDSRPKWFTPAAVRQWVDLGLRGLAPDGRDAPVWRGRNAERDAAFADLLYGTGLRLQEGASLLVDELPPLDPERRAYTCLLADACAKGSRGRKVYMPRRVREELDQYVGPEGERSAAIARAQRAHRYDSLPHLRVLVETRNRRLRLRAPGDPGTYDVPLDALGPRERRTLFSETPHGLAPLALWVNEDGLPRDVHAWENTFHTANRRLLRLAITNRVMTPHMLRHSFALAWYCIGRQLYERQMGHLTEDETRDFRTQFGDTWKIVSTLLGHASVETTMHIYLAPFMELQVMTVMTTAKQFDLGMLDAFFQSDGRIVTDLLERV